MAGGGVPSEYKGREHVWHKKAKQYAEGGSVEMAGGGIAKLLKAAKTAKEAPAVVVPSRLSQLQAEVAEKSGQYGAKRVQRAADEVKNLERMYKPDALRQVFIGDNAKALVTMNPADFEKYAKKLKGQTRADIGPKMAELAKQGEIDKYTVPTDEYIQHLMQVRGGFDDVPYLNLRKDETGLPMFPNVTGHEGRHRSRAFAEMGEPSSLVSIQPSGGLREDLPRRSREEFIEALRKELDLKDRLVIGQDDINVLQLPDVYAEGGAVNMAEGGAAFGVFPQMKGKRSKQDPEAAKNFPVDLARGFVSGVLGAPGDIESFARLPYELITGKDSPTYLPTSEDIEKRLPFRSEAPVSRAASGLGQLAGGFYLGPGSPLKAVGALPGAIRHGAKEFAKASAAGAPRVIKPKGGNFLAGGVDKQLERLKTQLIAGETPAQRIPRHEALLSDPSLNKDQIDRVLYHLDETKKEAAIDQWIDRNFGNYVKKDLSSPDDPLRLFFDRRAIEIDEAYAKDIKRADRAAQRAADEADPRRKANFEREAERIRTEASADRDFAREHITHIPGRLEDYAPEADSGLKASREKAGFPAEGLAQTEMAKRWETLTDEAISSIKAGKVQDTMRFMPELQNAERDFINYTAEIGGKFDERLRMTGTLSDNEIRVLNEKTPIRDKASILGEDFVGREAEYNKLLMSLDRDAYEVGQQNPFISKLAPETPLYRVQKFLNSDNFADMGFDHVIDILKQDVMTGRIRPDQLNKVSMEDAVRRTADFDQEQARKMAVATIKATDGMPTYKDYPEAGYKWIELKTPEPKIPEGSVFEEYNGMQRLFGPDGESLSQGATKEEATRLYKRQEREKMLEDALQYEGDTMGHCVGGYCPNVLSGKSRIFSLRDRKGEPHVTIELGKAQGRTEYGDMQKIYDQAQQEANQANFSTTGQFNNFYNDRVKELQMALIDKQQAELAPRIVQIRGKQNEAPSTSYLPYVQDFVKSGTFSEVGDLRNTGLIRKSDLIDKFSPDELDSISAGEYLTKGEYDDLLYKSLNARSPGLTDELGLTTLPPAPEGMKEGGAIKMAAGGIAGAIKLLKGGPKQLTKLEMDALRSQGLGVPGQDFADVMNPADVMRMSEALGNAGAEGKTLNLTQADRSRVFGPNKGGTGFSGLQLTSKPHQEARTTWGVGKPGHASRLINANTPDTIWSTFIGSPTQHMSNPVTVQRMYEAHKKANPSPELVAQMNKMLNSAVHAKTGKPIFSEGIDISNPDALNQAKTFDQRKLVAQSMIMGGEKRGEKASQEAFKIIKEETDPLLADAPTYAVGNRLFTIDSKTGIYRPDLNAAFPYQVTGNDLGMLFEPAPVELAARDFVKKYEGRLNKSGKPQPLGHKDLTATTPKQFIDEDYLNFLQKEGYAKGGKVKPVSGLSTVNKLCGHHD